MTAQDALLAVAEQLRPTHPLQAQSIWRIAVGLTPPTDPVPVIAAGSQELLAHTSAVTQAFVQACQQVPVEFRTGASMTAVSTVLDWVLAGLAPLPLAKSTVAGVVAHTLLRHGLAYDMTGSDALAGDTPIAAVERLH